MGQVRSAKQYPGSDGFLKCNPKPVPSRFGPQGSGPSSGWRQFFKKNRLPFIATICSLVSCNLWTFVKVHLFQFPFKWNILFLLKLCLSFGQDFSPTIESKSGLHVKWAQILGPSPVLIPKLKPDPKASCARIGLEQGQSMDTPIQNLSYWSSGFCNRPANLANTLAKLCPPKTSLPADINCLHFQINMVHLNDGGEPLKHEALDDSGSKKIRWHWIQGDIGM